jgi:hypothetical protein
MLQRVPVTIQQPADSVQNALWAHLNRMPLEKRSHSWSDPRDQIDVVLEDPRVNAEETLLKQGQRTTAL